MCSHVYVLNYILKDIILLSFALPLGWFYRYKKGMKKGYMKFDDIDYDSEPKYILSSTVEKINLSNFELNNQNNQNIGEKIVWMDGMPLPPSPIIVDRLTDIDEANESGQNKNEVRQNVDSNKEKEDEENNDSFVPQINLESMKDLKI